jgi:AraC-like DNA-binding protein
MGRNFTREFLHVPDHSTGYLGLHTNVESMPMAHRHDELELNLVTIGSASYLLGGQRYDLNRHTLVWLFPGQDHSLLDKSQRFDYWLGLFRPGLLRLICTTPMSRTLLSKDPRGRFCRQLTEQTAEELIVLFNRVADAEDEATRNVGIGYAALAAWEAFSREEDSVGGKVHECVEAAVRMIRDEIDPIPLGPMAERLGLSGPYLSELFKSQTGMTLSEYRNKQRLRRFLEIDARREQMSMLAAALQAGFGSYAQFHRVFRQLMGISPAQYRARRSQRDFAGSTK